MALPMTIKNSTSPWTCESNSQLPEWLKHEESTGTTIMAVEFDGGVVIGADSRTTTGAYIANRIRLSCSTQAIADVVSFQLEFHSIQMQQKPLVHTAANLFREMCYKYRDSLMAGIIVAGWDEKKGGQVFSVPLGGMIVQQGVALGGSGSTYMYAYVDATYKDNMTKEECYNFVSKGIALSMMRDGSSGGVIRLAAITKDGVERKTILGNELPRYYEG
ncbi:putative proteasome subunit beta type-6-like isoform X2 [Apostichopus japonicus]|uniref:Putative proteasome subunit beta type-6-like isoform X2 n=1 Tax=Stichopus japonicus TaxID=307972 RepID=A0A2G8LKK7_STIJA|nr:putative proteasome subunit beta type-6-like isoform X2 [Apostichopus japonicus]